MNETTLAIIVQCCYAIAGVIAILGLINILAMMLNKEKGLTKTIITNIATIVTLITIAILLS